MNLLALASTLTTNWSASLTINLVLYLRDLVIEAGHTTKRWQDLPTIGLARVRKEGKDLKEGSAVKAHAAHLASAVKPDRVGLDDPNQLLKVTNFSLRIEPTQFEAINLVGVKQSLALG